MSAIITRIESKTEQQEIFEQTEDIVPCAIITLSRLMKIEGETKPTFICVNGDWFQPCDPAMQRWCENKWKEL